MRLRYDAITWFNHILPHQLSSNGDCARHGSAYVSACLTQKRDNDVAQSITNKAARSPAAEIMKLTCVKPTCQCEKLHTPSTCTGTIGLIGGGTIECGQFFDRASTMDSFITDGVQFALHSRPGSTRDIVLFPTSHTHNEEFVEMGSTWEAIFEVEKRLRATLLHFAGEVQIEFPIESIYFNYGSWTSAMTQNKSLKNAHAHVHLLLTRDYISTFNQDRPGLADPTSSNKLYVLNLTGCHRDPVDYEYEDAITLRDSQNLFDHAGESEEKMKTLPQEMLTEFSEREKSEPSSNVICNDGKNDSPSEETIDTNLYPQTPSSPSNTLVRGYCYFFIPVIILIFAIVYYQFRQDRLFAFPPFAHSIPKRTSTT